MLTAEEEADFPPCAIEIILGIEGRLFVVLPTGVTTELPFACNAPFIQDPARVKIKDPEISPTNRWLLDRAGRLAANVMLEWLQQSNSNPVERASAYDLMTDVDQTESSLEGTCGTLVERAFADDIDGQNILLTDEGRLTGPDQSVIIPGPILDVWPNTQASALLDSEGRPALSRYVSEDNREKLINWDVVGVIDDSDVLLSLRYKHLPRPESWRQLLSLWAYLAPLITGYGYYGRKDDLHIVPVQGKDILCAAQEVVRLGEKKLLPTEEDWKFLGDRLAVVNQNWIRFLTEQRRSAETNDDQKLSERVDAAHSVLKAISLHEPSDTGKVINQVAADFFRGGTVTLDDCIRIAQIAAKLGASAGDQFQFVCQDRHLRSISDIIVFDPNGALELIFPEEWCETHLLHPDYLKSFTSCTREEWERWVSSGRSGLHSFAPIEQRTLTYWSTKTVVQELGKRGYSGKIEPRYQAPSYRFSDLDFDQNIWAHWVTIGEEDNTILGKITEQILTGPARFWSSSLSATVTEVATNGNTRKIITDGLLPSWIMKLREKECLRDNHGFYRKPAELLRRTPETEALMDVEPFIHGLLDNETTRPLLNLLGVGDIPTGPDRLLNRLQALSKATNSPPHEVEKWYRRLDQILESCSTNDFNTICNTFSRDRLVLTERGTWESTSGVFLYSDEEDAPGADTVRTAVRELTLWRKIGVADRPTAELAINWLQSLPSGEPLSQEDARRVRALLARHPKRIWEECQHWISLSGAWTPIEEFDYALTMQTLIPWSHLHQWVKHKTADLQRLPSETTEMPPFSTLPPLSAHVEERFNRKSTNPVERKERPWLRQLGLELIRIKLDDDEETARIRELAANLASTLWQTTNELEVITYIEGKPAGTARRAEAIWADNTIYAENKPIAKLARAVAQELGRAFRRPDIIDAIKLCFDHSPDFVSEYIEENFNLVPREEIEMQQDVISPEDTPPTTKDSDIPGGPIDEEASLEEALEPEHEDMAVESAGASENDSTDEEMNVSDEDELNDLEEVSPKSRPKPKPPKPGIMERFADSKGFHKDQENRFFDDQGNWISKANGSLFPWEQRSASGEVLHHYWPKDHCLEREPLQLESEIWSIIENHPETYVLVLSNPDGNPVEVSGIRLRDMRERGDLTLHPSTYRLVYEHDKEI